MPIGVVAGKARVHGRARRRHLALRRRLRARSRRHLLRRHVRAPSAGARRRQGRAAPSQGRRARAAGASRRPHGRTGRVPQPQPRTAGPGDARRGIFELVLHQLRRRGAARRRCSGRRCDCSACMCRKVFPASSPPRTATPISRRSRTPSQRRSMRWRPAASWARNAAPADRRPSPYRLQSPRRRSPSRSSRS